jgi:hypothetical protein
MGPATPGGLTGSSPAARGQASPSVEPAGPSPRLMQMLLGLEHTQMLHVAAKLGVPDLLSDGPKSAAELSAATRTDADALRRVLRALSVEGIFREDEDGRFALTRESAALRSGVQGSVRALAVMSGEGWYWRTYGGLLETVRTGRNAFQPLFGMELYDYLKQDQEAGRVFAEFMDEHSVLTAAQILDAYDFGAYHAIVDVGGGRASLLIRLLKIHPAMRGVLFDAPAVLEGARPILEAQGIADRCERVAGSFFESVPSGGDAWLLRNVIHDWDDERAGIILKNCRDAMGPAGTLLISEAVLPQGRATLESRYCDLQVMVALGGRQRTGAELRSLLDAAGFELAAIRPTGPVLSMVEARPRQDSVR